MNGFVVYALPMVIAYAVTVKWIVDRWWMPDSYYSHGPLVPIVAVVVLWTRRVEWSSLAARHDLRGWWLLGPGLLMHLCGAALMIDSLSAASLVLSLVGVVWLGMGPARLGQIWPVLLLVFLAIPLPIFMTGRIAFELKEVAIQLSEYACAMIGLDVTRVAADLYVSPHPQPLKVADACSGLRSLMALTTLGYCVAFFMGSQKGARRWILLLSAVPIAVLTNVFRITGICWSAREYGVQFAGTTGHDTLGWAAWVVAMAMLLALDWLVSPRRRKRSA